MLSALPAKLNTLVNRVFGLGRKPTTPFASFYDLEATDLDGLPISFKTFRGKARQSTLDSSTESACCTRDRSVWSAQVPLPRSFIILLYPALCTFAIIVLYGHRKAHRVGQVVLICNVASFDTASKVNYKVRSRAHSPSKTKAKKQM